MELPGRCRDWLDTFTVQGLNSWMARAEGGDLYLATSGDFAAAMDTLEESLNWWAASWQ